MSSSFDDPGVIGPVPLVLDRNSNILCSTATPTWTLSHPTSLPPPRSWPPDPQCSLHLPACPGPSPAQTAGKLTAAAMIARSPASAPTAVNHSATHYGGPAQRHPHAWRALPVRRCSKAFGWHSTLLKHHSSHSGEKPHNCLCAAKTLPWLVAGIAPAHTGWPMATQV